MSPKLRRLVLACLAALCLLGGWRPITAQGPDYRLTVLHVSENHGQWTPVQIGNVSLGGVARRATLINQIKAQVPNVLVLDPGDISQGSLLFNKFQGQEGRDLYNALGVDAVALGNHEFDFGPKVLLDRFVTGAQFDVLSANADFSVEPGLTGKVKPYVVKEVGGQKVGLVGVMHDYLAQSVSPAFRVRSTNPYEAVRAAVKDLQTQGVNKIIVLSHIGYDGRRFGQAFDDLGLAAEVDGIDMIVSGHTETRLGDPATFPQALGAPSGPFPTVVKGPGGAPVVITHAYKGGLLLARLDLVFDDKGVLTSWQGAPIPVDASLAEDLKVAGVLAGLNKAVDEIRAQVVGKVASDLPGERPDVRGREAALGNLVADAALAATASDKTQIALINGGGIRTSLKAGDVTYGDALTVLPFGNKIVDLNLTGWGLVSALENGLSDYSPPGVFGGRFPQVAGLRFTADLSQKVGQRVQRVEIGNAQQGYTPLDPNGVYRVATNDFMASGGDGYTVLTQGGDVHQTDILLADALADYLRARGTVSPKVEGRITLTSGGAAPVPAQATGSPVTPTPPSATPTLDPVSLTATATGAARAATVLAATRTPPPTLLAATRTPASTPAPLPPTGGSGGDGWLLGLLGAALLAAGLVLALRRRTRPADGE